MTHLILAVAVVVGSIEGGWLTNTGEPTVAVAPNGKRVLVAAQGEWARYALDGQTFSYLDGSALPTPCPLAWFSDAVAVWEQTYGTRGRPSIVTMRGAWCGTYELGLYRGLIPDEVTVLDPQPVPDFPDKPWLDLASDDGTMWLSWSRFGADGGPCIANSQDRGRTWTPCYRPPASHLSTHASGIASLSLAPSAAIVVWATPLTASVCDLGACDPVTVVHAYEPAPPLPVPWRAPSLPQVAGDDRYGEAVAVWAEWVGTIGRAMALRYRNGGWELPPTPIGPAGHWQFQPAVSRLDRQWVVSVYELVTATSAVMKVYLSADARSWREHRTFGPPAYPIVLGEPAEFLGDYHDTSCNETTCVTAWTGTAPDNPAKRRIHLAAYGGGCASIAPSGAGSTWPLLMAPVLLVMRRSMAAKKRGRLSKAELLAEFRRRVAVIAAERDALRDLLTDLNEIGDSVGQAVDEMEAALDTLSQYL